MARVTAALLTGLIVLSVGSLGLSNAASSTSAESNSKKIICYYPSWAAYRPGDGKFGPEDIDPTLCTHVVYSFAGLDNKTLTIEALDSKLDIDRGYYEKTVALRKKGIKVMLAIGGWSDSEGNKYSRLVNNATSRAQFVSNVTQFLEKYCFDGLDLDWEYPVCWQTDCTAGAASDNAGFASLVRELRTAFEPRGWLLSAAVSANRNVANVAYDVKILSEDLDWIGVMAYDYHGSYDGQTGHNSPLYYYPGDTPTYFNVNSSIWHYIEMGASRDKLVLGLPLYGQSFTLEDVNKHSLHDKTKGPGVAGELTQAAGTLAFSEICYNVTKQGGWSVVRDPEGRIGPYAYRGDQWVSYDDTEDLKRKSRFALDLGLGGVMVWALGSDDFTNRCGCGKQPLLTAINDEIRGQTGTAKNCT